METTINSIGVLYGTVLILAACIRHNPILEAMRIDALIMPDPAEGSRPISLIIGLLVIGYAFYSLFIK